jgi:hypothetical protein
MSDILSVVSSLANSNDIKLPPYYLHKFIKDAPKLVDNIKNKYKQLIFGTLKEFLNESGFLLTTEPDDDGSDEYLDTVYVQKMISLPLFWQDIIALVYMSLELYRNIRNNSYIISLGESPLKLVFIQQILNTIPEIKNVLLENGMSTDVEFGYFPLSGLSGKDINSLGISYILDTKRDLDSKEMDIFIDSFKRLDSQKADSVLEHFKLFSLDPLSIILGGRNVYFEDRCETYSSLTVFIYLYSEMCRLQGLNNIDRDLLYSRLFIIGFDNKADISNDLLIVNRINYLLCKIITGRSKMIDKMEKHFIQINFNSINKKQYNLRSDDFSLFTNQRDVVSKLFQFMTTPENTYNRSRCLLSKKIMSPMREDSEQLKDTINIKQSGRLGINCNIINLSLMIFINELAKNGLISNIITNIDRIDNNSLFYNNTDTSNVDKLIIDTFNNNRDELQFVFGNNILNNLLSIKGVVMEQQEINREIVKILSSDNSPLILNSVFRECVYRLPLKL